MYGRSDNRGKNDKGDIKGEPMSETVIKFRRGEVNFYLDILSDHKNKRGA